MTDFPLRSFLITLERDGIFLAVRDYDRIALVLGTDGEWTLGRLRNVLVALLAKDPDQRELILRRFDDAFDPNLPPLVRELALPVEIDRLRGELARNQPRHPDETPPLRSPSRSVPTSARKPWWERRPVKVAVLVVLLALIGILGYRDTCISREPPPNFQIDPPLRTLAAEPGRDSNLELALVNLGGGKLTPGTVTVEGDGFSFAPHGCSGHALAARERCTLNLRFRSDKPGQYSASIQAQSDQGKAESRISAESKESDKPPDPLKLDKLPIITHVPRRPVLRSIQNIANPAQDDWREPAWATLVLLILLLGFAVYLRRYQRLPMDTPPPWNGDLPRHFPFERLGGPPAPRLDRQTLAHLADCMGYFRSVHASRRPDISASVMATVAQGGIPTLRFLQRKQLRHLVILEDGQAGEIARLNPIAKELREGMAHLGVEVLLGCYYGDPGTAWDEHGRAFYLDDLEAQRNGLLLLVFGEADRAQIGCRLSLERLARWPHRAWMDLSPVELRAPRTTLPERCGLPSYPATADGLLRAFQRFLSETAPQSKAAAPTQPFHSWSDDPSADVERRLGDALPWAAACALIQPFSYGLADGLRRACFKHLPNERIERLAALPGTSITAEGLRYADSVAERLQTLFFRRIPDTQRSQILDYLLKALNDAWEEQQQLDPNLSNSPAHLAWERRYQQLRLMLEPEEALKRLSELDGTPLGGAIGRDLQRLAPHLPRPNDRLAQQRLARLAPACGIPLLDRFRLRRWHRAVAGMLALGLLGAGLLSLYLGWQAFQSGPRMVVTAEAEISTPVKLLEVSKQGGSSRDFPGLPLATRLPAGKDWRLELGSVESAKLGLGIVRHDSKVVIGLEPLSPPPAATATLVVIDLYGKAVAGATVQLRADGDVQSHPADRQILLPAGDWEARLVSADGFASRWQKLTLKTGQRLEQPLAYDSLFRDRLRDGSLGPQVASIPGGIFKMGQQGLAEPVHQVAISPFAIGTHEVSFTEYDRFAESTGRQKPDEQGFGRDARPVINITWDDAVAYAAWLSQQTGTAYRLPTEAEWEYAARAGTDTAYWWGDEYGEGLANCWPEVKKTTPVGSYPANSYGLYDTAGNVWEWVSDWYGEYPQAAGQPSQDPQGPAQGSYRVVRGGSWDYDAGICRSAFRNRYDPSYRYDNLGFRLSRTDPLPSYPLTLGTRHEPAIVQRETTPPSYAELRDKLKDGSEGPAMVVLPAGNFKMGSPNGEKGHQTDEEPVHQVKLTGFAIGRYEVTVGEYLRFATATQSHYPEWLEKDNQYNIRTGSNDLYKKFGDALQEANHPIIGVSWQDATAYAQWLSRETGKPYRLPTEAEWEYAARAGSGKAYAFGDDPAKLGEFAWCADNAQGKPQKVGTKLPNAWGLYDMHGNVWEWVSDWYGGYPKAAGQPSLDPQGPAQGSYRVVRGGSWYDVAGLCRSAYRYWYDPSYRLNLLGFRLSRTLP